VNSNTKDAATLKAAMEKDDIPWRSFAASEETNAQWNNPATPSYYVLDHAGVIRHKWLGTPGEERDDRRGVGKAGRGDGGAGEEVDFGPRSFHQAK
jgi:hypothetical protein